MSVQLISWAYEQETGSPTRKAVLLVLANCANHHTGRCDPSIERICKETELSDRAVRQAITDLVASGLLDRDKRRRADGSRRTYEYRFPLASAANQPAGDAGSHQPAGDAGKPEELQDQEPFEPEVVLHAPLARTAKPNGSTERPRNETWDALSAIFGEPTTRSAQKVRGKVCASLRSARASPAEIEIRARRWPLHFDSATLTDLALEKHWDTLGRKPLRRQ